MSDRQTPSDTCQPNSDKPLNERMRHKAQNGEMVDQYFTEAGQLLNEGADKITALEAQLADAQEAATSFERWFNKWRAYAEGLEAQLADVREAAKDYLEMQEDIRNGVTIRDWTEREERLRIALARLEEAR